MQFIKKFIGKLVKKRMWKVLWTKLVLEEFVDKALLTREEEMILRTRVAGWTRVKQAQEFNMSVGTVDNIIKRLRAKYDEVQRMDPILPPRKDGENEIRL